ARDGAPGRPGHLVASGIRKSARHLAFAGTTCLRCACRRLGCVARVSEAHPGPTRLPKTRCAMCVPATAMDGRASVVAHGGTRAPPGPWLHPGFAKAPVARRLPTTGWRCACRRPGCVAPVSEAHPGPTRLPKTR